MGEPPPIEWDQTKAKERVQYILDIEKKIPDTGIPWDKISWMHNEKEAIKKAQKENRPIFAYLFMKTEVGPPDAPC